MSISSTHLLVVPKWIAQCPYKYGDAQTQETQTQIYIYICIKKKVRRKGIGLFRLQVCISFRNDLKRNIYESW